VSQSPYELIGRQTARIADLEERLDQALALLRALKDGSASLERLEVHPDRIVLRAEDAPNGTHASPPVPA
jgi:hypothetical protein